jgi:hypothetical protein
MKIKCLSFAIYLSARKTHQCQSSKNAALWRCDRETIEGILTQQKADALAKGGRIKNHTLTVSFPTSLFLLDWRKIFAATLTGVKGRKCSNFLCSVDTARGPRKSYHCPNVSLSLPLCKLVLHDGPQQNVGLLQC